MLVAATAAVDGDELSSVCALKLNEPASQQQALQLVASLLSQTYSTTYSTLLSETI